MFEFDELDLSSESYEQYVIPDHFRAVFDFGDRSPRVVHDHYNSQLELSKLKEKWKRAQARKKSKNPTKGWLKQYDDILGFRFAANRTTFMAEFKSIHPSVIVSMAKFLMWEGTRMGSTAMNYNPVYNSLRDSIERYDIEKWSVYHRPLVQTQLYHDLREILRPLLVNHLVALTELIALISWGQVLAWPIGSRGYLNAGMMRWKMQLPLWDEMIEEARKINPYWPIRMEWERFAHSGACVYINPGWRDMNFINGRPAFRMTSGLGYYDTILLCGLRVSREIQNYHGNVILRKEPNVLPPMSEKDLAHFNSWLGMFSQRNGMIKPSTLGDLRHVTLYLGPTECSEL